ncbi:hypothetical protein JXA05_00270 [Candidatus Peregrinibacteria bacterium]|nr:hypothetical protein [Candidatus Peregrinibacteria bacterium]
MTPKLPELLNYKHVVITLRMPFEMKADLGAVARHKGITLSALIKLYISTALEADLHTPRPSGITLAEQLDHYS